MFYTLLMCFSPYLGAWKGGLPAGLEHNVLMQFSTLGSSKMGITLQRSLDQSQAGPHTRENATYPSPPLRLFATLPQGVVLFI